MSSSKLSHLSAITFNAAMFTIWSAGLNVKVLKNLRLRAYLGLTPPTPKELRLMAKILRETDFAPAIYLAHNTVQRITALTKTHSIFSLENSFQAAAHADKYRELLVQVLDCTANAYEQKPVKNYITYQRSIHEAVQNKAFNDTLQQIFDTASAPIARA